MSRASNFGTGRDQKVAQIGIELGYLVASRRHLAGPGDQLWVSPLISRAPLLIEVKGTIDLPWRSTWGPEDRAAMLDAGRRWRVEPILAWWPPHLGAPVWLPPEDWPN